MGRHHDVLMTQAINAVVVYYIYENNITIR